MNINAMVGKERQCDVCGKGFIIYQDWAYKKGQGDGTKVFCSWKCLRNWESRHLSPADRRDAIERMVREGKSIREIADALGCDSRQVYYWKKKMEKDGAL